MSSRNGFVISVIVCVALVAVVALPTTTHAGYVPPLARSYCSTPSDTGIVAHVTCDLGDDIGVPVYIGSDDMVEAFRFRFYHSDVLTFDSVQAGSWQGGFGPWFYDGDYLVVGQLIESTPMQPSTDVPFLTLWFSTTCEEVHATAQTIGWAPSNDPFSPTTYLVDDGGCQTDPIEYKDPGSVTINAIDINFSVSHDTVLIGDDVMITVYCENDYEFNSFVHHFTVDSTILTYSVPFLTKGPRFEGTQGSSWDPSGAVTVQGEDADGFGTSDVDGREFYQLKFKVISNVDDVSSAIHFVSTPEVTALDCDQRLDLFNPSAVTHEDGSITVLPYEAVIDIGEAVWNNQSTCEFSVPLLMRNNYPVTNFRFSIGFTDDDNNPLEFVDADETFWPLTSNEEYCVGAGLPYATVNAGGSLTIPPSNGEFQTIAYLNFRNTTSSQGDIDYTLAVLDYGCYPDDPTWVETPGYQATLRYYFDDDQIVVDTGSIAVSDPYTSVSVPGCQSATCKFPPDCESWAYSGVYVTSNQDLDSVWFDLDWNFDKYCVTMQNVDADMHYSGGAVSGYSIRIDNVMAGPTTKYATVYVRNGTHDPAYGSFVVSGVGAVESCAHGSSPAGGNGGGIYTHALPIQYASCFPNHNGQKLAAVPRSFNLGQNYPNPFNAGTVIDFTLSDDAHVRMEIFNITGQRVRTLIDDALPAGEHSIEWNGRTADGREVATGVYLYRMDAGPYTMTRKMVLLK